MTIGAEQTPLLARPHRPLSGGGQPERVRLQMGVQRAWLDPAGAATGTPAGVFYRSRLRRVCVAVVELEEGIFFFDLLRNYRIRIDPDEIAVSVSTCGPWRTFLIERAGQVLYRRAYWDISWLTRALLFDPIEDAEPDFFRATQREKSGRFANLRHYLASLGRDAGSTAG